MLGIHRGSYGCLASTALALGLTLALPIMAQAQSIPLANPSFELPQITPEPGSQDPANFVQPFIDGWDETGPVTSVQGFDGLLDTGVFVNIPVQIAQGVFIDPIPNAHGNQLAYMQVNLAKGPIVSISQEVATVYEEGLAYSFTIGIGPGVLYPPTSDDRINDPATIVLSLGFLGTTSGEFIEIQNRVVRAQDVILPSPKIYPPFPPPLVDFTVTANAEAVNSPTIDGTARGNEIVVKITQLGGTSGGFNLDKARLSAVPEPGSLALLGLAGAWCLRRRR